LITAQEEAVLLLSVKSGVAKAADFTATMPDMRGVGKTVLLNEMELPAQRDGLSSPIRMQMSVAVTCAAGSLKVLGQTAAVCDEDHASAPQL